MVVMLVAAQKQKQEGGLVMDMEKLLMLSKLEDLGLEDSVGLET